MASPERKWYQNERVFAALFTASVALGVLSVAYSDEIAESLTQEPANPVATGNLEPYSDKQSIDDLVETGLNLAAAACLTVAGVAVTKQGKHELK